MRYQHANADVGVKEGEKVVEPEITKPENEYGFVAVCAGEGLEELFGDIGADTIVSGGQTMNPSTDDILNAIMKTPAKVVFVLPNNKNIIMAAEQAAPLAKDRDVRVLPTKTIPQGISAMLMFDETASADENQMTMLSAAENVETAQVTFAARDSEVDGKPIKQAKLWAFATAKLNISAMILQTLPLKLLTSCSKKANIHSSQLFTVRAQAKMTQKLLKKHFTKNTAMTLKSAL